MFCVLGFEDFGGGFILEKECLFFVWRENMDVLGKVVKFIVVFMIFWSFYDLFCLIKENVVYNFGFFMVFGVIFFKIFLLIVCFFCVILNDVISCMCEEYCVFCGFCISLSKFEYYEVVRNVFYFSNKVKKLCDLEFNLWIFILWIIWLLW